MKKIFFLGLFCLSVCGMAPQQSQAGLLHHFFRNHCNNFSTYICIKPYNAFTPVCSGSISCNGCCPINFGGCGAPMGFAPPPPMMMAPPYMPPYCCTMGGCCDVGCLPAPASVMNTPTVPSDPGQSFTPPPPQPLPAVSYLNTGMAPPVQPVGYFGYNPYYYPRPYAPYPYPYGNRYPYYPYGR